MSEKDQNALDRSESIFPPQPSAGDSGQGGITAVSRAPDLAPTGGGQVVTLSEPDKVNDADVPLWTEFADLTIEEKFAQAKLMDFEVRDAYLRERCRVAKLEVAYAASALDRATAIIETNLPFFLIHFEDMDAQGGRSDLKGKIVGKTEWLRQNLPDISRGTFYAAYNSVKARYTEQTRLMLGGEVPPTAQPKTRTNDLTPIQSEVVTALVGQGFKNSDAILMVKGAEGKDFDSLFKSALTYRGGGDGTANTAGVTETDTADGQEVNGAAVVGSGADSAPEDDSEDDEESDEPDGGLERKHYWLTPPELMAQLTAEFGEMYDPCPYPPPEGFNGLEAEWGPVNYVNPLFHEVVQNGKRIGISMWIRKALEEQAKGKTSVLVYPQYSWFHLLLPDASITWFVGKPGQGKSLASINVAATVSTGRDWADGARNTMGPKRVLMYCPEDSIARVVVPRLIAAGADLSKIDLLDSRSFRTYCPDGTKIKRCLAMDEDMPALLTLLGKHPDIALMVCDPITGIWGNTNVNHNKEIWPVVAHLIELCEKRNLTFLGVAHTNKRGSDADAIDKIQGGSTMAGAARAAFLFSRDPDSEDKHDHVMTNVKVNYTDEWNGLKFRTVGDTAVTGDKRELETVRLDWLEATEMSADDVMDKQREKKVNGGSGVDGKLGLAMAFLRVNLQAGNDVQYKLIEQAEEKEGISRATMFRAAKEMGLTSSATKPKKWSLPYKAEPETRMPDDDVM